MIFAEKISVVMPTYNTDVTILKEAVDSILNQTFGDFEFIIIDDGSTNNSVEYLKSLQDQRVKIIRNDTNIGITKSLNIGLRAAKGKYIARMDSDDIAFPDRFEIQYSFMESHPDVFVCGTKVNYFTGLFPPAEQHKDQKKFVVFKENAIYGKKLLFEKYKIEDMESYKVKLIFCDPGPMHPTVFFNHEKLIQYHIEYDEELTYAQDYDMWMRISEIGQICILPETLLHYRIHFGQISKAHREKQRQCSQRTQSKLLEPLLGNVTEEDLSFHFSHSSRYWYDGNTKISSQAVQWYGKIMTANKKMKIYDQKKLENYINQIKISLIFHSFTSHMPAYRKVILLFYYLPFPIAFKKVLTILGTKASRLFCFEKLEKC